MAEAGEVTSSSLAHDPEYPDALAKAEDALLLKRRAAVARDGAEPGGRLGVGISGGGIRSATFALGFFQALAQRDCTKHIDYLSTVSGGGYFGGFFGALFRRDTVQGHADVQTVLEPKNQTDVLRYLRENGSYLAPAGTDSLLLGAATLFRNWCVVQLLFLTALFGGFLVVQIATKLAHFSTPLVAAAALIPVWRSFGGVTPSPWFALAVLTTAFWVTPLTWSYWVIGRDVPTFLTGYARAVAKVAWTVLLYVVVAAAGFALAVQVPAYTELGFILAGVAGLALSIGLMAMIGNATWTPTFALLGALSPVGVVCLGQHEWTAWWVAGTSALASALTGAMLFRELRWVAHRNTGTPEVIASTGVRELDEDNEGRFQLSDALKTALVFTCALLVLAAIDTAARWLIDILLARSESSLAKQGVGFATFIAVASSVLRRAWALFSKPPGRGQRPGLSMTVLAGIAALVTVMCLLLVCDAVAYLVVQRALSARDLTAFAMQSATAIGAVLAMNLILGSSRNLLNASTQLPLYSARIIRAYLGASNPERAQSKPVQPKAAVGSPANDVAPKGGSERPGQDSLASNERRSREIGTGKPSPTAATRVMPGDDIPAQAYWRWDNAAQPATNADQSDPYEKGAPLHLVNVTINETVDGRSQIQQGDRKGTGLAVGPGGFSVGVRHHAVFFEKKRHSYPRQGWKVFRFEADASEPSNAKAPARSFGLTGWINRQHVLENFPFDQLSFGQWIGISGAAFSTGLGSRTNLGLSVLAALANVRLGFWWRPGIKTSVSWLHKLGALFWVQTYLFRELLARFPGTSRALWYLSDGGHFENLGGYELIRRRLPYILLIDSEEDPDSECESLANLVRKARLDFGAEIVFFEHAAHSFTGSIRELQRGDWSLDPSNQSASKLIAAGAQGLSRAHAALAQITYRDGSKGWLLYVKPTLTGEEPQDLRNYHLSHPAFPHEATTDQFFDEAQWESYRFLGQTIGERLLEREGVLRKFFDRDLQNPGDALATTLSSKPVPKTQAGAG